MKTINECGPMSAAAEQHQRLEIRAI